MLWAGNVRHAGVAVTSGQRCVFVASLSLVGNVPEHDSCARLSKEEPEEDDGACDFTGGFDWE